MRENWRRDAAAQLSALGTPEAWTARWGDAVGTDDARSREVADHLAAVVRDSPADGDDGCWDDWAAVLTPWGFDPTTVSVPVRIWHGDGDRAVPVTHGRWLAAHVPGAVGHFPELEDHASVERNNREVAYAWLSTLG